MRMKSISLIFLSVSGFSLLAQGREPCSGRKGGINHCDGKYFICNDGSTSQSKKICSEEFDASDKAVTKKSKKSTKEVAEKEESDE